MIALSNVQLSPKENIERRYGCEYMFRPFCVVYTYAGGAGAGAGGEGKGGENQEGGGQSIS